jgi:hypothetical protein
MYYIKSLSLFSKIFRKLIFGSKKLSKKVIKLDIYMLGTYKRNFS